MVRKFEDVASVRFYRSASVSGTILAWALSWSLT